MQYNSYFPASYQQSYQQGGFGQPQNQQQFQQIQQFQQMQQAIQPQQSLGGFIPVQSENEARMYQIAPGTSATFINENAPYCYTKTLGASQLDRPTFKRFRLVEETEDTQETPVEHSQDSSAYALQSDFEMLKNQFSEIYPIIERVKKELFEDGKPVNAKE